MQRKIYRTKLRPERRDEYIAAHGNVSSELLRRYKDAGITLCAVYILDDDMVLITEAEDHNRTALTLAQDSVDREWQSYLKPMKAAGDWQEMDILFHADLRDDSAQG